MKKAYDQYLSAHFSHVNRGSRQQWRSDSLRANYLELLSDLDRKAVVLEIGPGTGGVLAFLRNEAGMSNVSAIDLSAEVVEHCNRHFGGVMLVEDPAQFLRERESVYDLILMVHVLEHVPKSDTVPLLGAIHHALRPGGRLVIEVPNMANPISASASHYADFTHEVGYTASSLTQVLRMATFTDIEVHPFRIPRTSVARWVQWLLRWVLEKALLLLAVLYFGRPEINSANILAIGRKAPRDA
jgi:2-polyprenyl-3-methyl-5-hydroxy-6-metoxy-1,4-benzoquinol methylase